MSKKCVITQIHNEEKQQYEYFVKGYDITESIKILLKKHKEAYDKERRIFAEAKGYIEAQKEYETQLHNQQNEIQQLKQQLAEKDKEIAHLKEKDNYHLRYELAGADETITNLKEQLAEKDIRIEELEGQFAYECECNKQLVELQKQLAEKDKEIERLKVFEKAYYFNQTQVSQESMDLLLQNAYQVHNETQLAIQELEKVKEKIDCEMAIREYDISEQTADVCVSIADQIDNQIKELKG